MLALTKPSLFLGLGLSFGFGLLLGSLQVVHMHLSQGVLASAVSTILPAAWVRL